MRLRATQQLDERAACWDNFAPAARRRAHRVSRPRHDASDAEFLASASATLSGLTPRLTPATVSGSRISTKNFAVVIRHGNREFARVKCRRASALADSRGRRRTSGTPSRSSGVVAPISGSLRHAGEGRPPVQVITTPTWRSSRTRATICSKTIDRQLKQLVAGPFPATGRTRCQRACSTFSREFRSHRRCDPAPTIQDGFSDWLQLARLHRPDLNTHRSSTSAGRRTRIPRSSSTSFAIRTCWCTTPTRHSGRSRPFCGPR